MMCILWFESLHSRPWANTNIGEYTSKCGNICPSALLTVIENATRLRIDNAWDQIAIDCCCRFRGWELFLESTQLCFIGIHLKFNQIGNNKSYIILSVFISLITVSLISFTTSFFSARIALSARNAYLSLTSENRHKYYRWKISSYHDFRSESRPTRLSAGECNEYELINIYFMLKVRFTPSHCNAHSDCMYICTYDKIRWWWQIYISYWKIW